MTAIVATSEDSIFHFGPSWRCWRQRCFGYVDGASTRGASPRSPASRRRRGRGRRRRGGRSPSRRRRPRPTRGCARGRVRGSAQRSHSSGGWGGGVGATCSKQVPVSRSGSTAELPLRSADAKSPWGFHAHRGGRCPRHPHRPSLPVRHGPARAARAGADVRRCAGAERRAVRGARAQPAAIEENARMER